MTAQRALLSLLLSLLLSGPAFAQGVNPVHPVKPNGAALFPSAFASADNIAAQTATAMHGLLFAWDSGGSNWDRLLLTSGALHVNVQNATVAVTQSGAWTVTANAGSGTFAVSGTTFDGILKDGTGDTTQANVSGGRLHVDGSGVTQPVSGTVNIGTFPDNEPVNVAQMNGAAVTMGNGVSGTGVQRVTIASDSTGNIATINTSVTPGTSAAHLGKAEDAVASSGDTGVATWSVREDTPTATAANGDYIARKANQYGHQFIASICNDPTLTTSAVINATASGNTEVVPLTASQTIYVCGYNFIASGTADVRLVYGTGTACATGETGITGLYPLVANTGIAVPNGGAIQTKTASGNALCIETSASVNVRGMVTYAKGAF